MYYDNSAFILSSMIPKVSTKESLGEALSLEMQLEGCGGQWHGIDIEISFASQGLFEVLLEKVCMGGNGWRSTATTHMVIMRISRKYGFCIAEFLTH